MHTTTTVYLGVTDLEASATSPVFTDQDGAPWATVTIGGFETPGNVTFHLQPAEDANPLVLAEHLERLARDLRTDFSRWVASPESDDWTAVRKAISTAEAITKTNAGPAGRSMA